MNEVQYAKKHFQSFTNIIGLPILFLEVIRAFEIILAMCNYLFFPFSLYMKQQRKKSNASLGMLCLLETHIREKMSSAVSRWK